MTYYELKYRHYNKKKDTRDFPGISTVTVARSQNFQHLMRLADKHGIELLPAGKVYDNTALGFFIKTCNLELEFVSDDMLNKILEETDDAR